ncbi:hypothetical protein BBJ66_13180 [Rhizobium sp. RSm-3]|nr:hypothetical protein BBJ66_13180 [Rhizobium sp. RSm-3]
MMAAEVGPSVTPLRLPDWPWHAEPFMQYIVMTTSSLTCRYYADRKFPAGRIDGSREEARNMMVERAAAVQDKT